MKNTIISRFAWLFISIGIAAPLIFIMCISKSDAGIEIKWAGVLWILFVAVFVGAFCAEHINRFLNRKK
jgi:uncharacterized membrane protein